MRIAAFGFGNRMRKYLKYVHEHPEEADLVAVVETDPERLAEAGRQFGIGNDMLFVSSGRFFDVRPDVDGVIIGTPDDTHYDLCMKSLDAGYRVLLEKPVAQSYEQCRDILARSEELALPVTVCYVLRYHPFYLKLKEIIESGDLGEMVSVNHIVNVGIDRTMHTYVRGPWNNEKNANSMILSKCCHDVDLIVWLTGASASKVSSFGSLKWFRKEKAPAGSSDRCVTCGIEHDCPFSAVDLYQRRKEWISNFNVPQGKTLDEVLESEMENGRFGRCVYRCDNDVVDNQILSMQMDNGVVATLSMDCFTRRDDRMTNIKFVYGEIMADENTIKVSNFRTRVENSYDFTEVNSKPFHANADLMIVKDFIRSGNNSDFRNVPGLRQAVESHRICFMAEESRKSGKII